MMIVIISRMGKWIVIIVLVVVAGIGIDYGAKNFNLEKLNSNLKTQNQLSELEQTIPMKLQN